MAVNPVKTPFTNMSFTPDVPSSALGATEYNAGYNIETDVRSVKSVLGDEYILNAIDGNVIFVTSGFRNNYVFWFVAATEQGQWYGIPQTGNITNITPQSIPGQLSPTLTTYANISGNSASNGIFANVSQYSTTGNGAGATFTINVNATNTPYSGNGVISTGTTFSNYTGISSNQATEFQYWTASPASTSGSGTGAVFKISLQNNNTSYNNTEETNVQIINGGHGYRAGDTVTISGFSLGGSSPTNDLTMTLGGTLENVTTVTLDQVGSNYNIGDTITIAGNVLGGNIVTNDLTFKIEGNINNYQFGDFSGYTSSTVITGSWNGSTLFLNDMINPPMYLTGTATELGIFDYPDPQTGQTYVWNYDVSTDINGNIIPLYSSLTAGFVRVYNSPNVGSLLIAGDLQGVVAANVVYPTPGTVQKLPTTVRWSQNFGLNSGPLTWAPTLTNVANEVEIPVRGPVIDGFALNGNFYVLSYWDCVQFSPIAYTSTSAPVFGILLNTQGRGLINENCWAIVDQVAYGVDSRDIWSFTGGAFSPIGDQKVKNYFYNNLNANYIDQIFMINNTDKYQIEIYYPDLYSTGYCNQMISYRYDLQIWNPPRQVSNATMATEAPRFYSNIANLATRGVVYSSGSGNVSLIQKDVGSSFVNGQPIPTLFQRDNISFGQAYSASVQVHRVYPEVYGTGNIDITVGGANSVGSTPTFRPTQEMQIQTDNPWVQINQNEYRIISIQVSSNSAVDSWQMSAANWQVTQVQDTR